MSTESFKFLPEERHEDYVSLSRSNAHDIIKLSNYDNYDLLNTASFIRYRLTEYIHPSYQELMGVVNSVCKLKNNETDISVGEYTISKIGNHIFYLNKTELQDKVPFRTYMDLVASKKAIPSGCKDGIEFFEKMVDAMHKIGKKNKMTLYYGGTYSKLKFKSAESIGFKIDDLKTDISKVFGQHKGFNDGVITYIAPNAAPFAAHLDDYEVNAINFQLAGGSKIWMVVHKNDKRKLRKLVLDELHSYKKKHPAQAKSLNIGCKCSADHKNLLIDPAFLRKNKISFRVIEQKPGDVMVIGRSAYHMGMSFSNNTPGIGIGVATNVLLNDYVEEFEDVTREKFIRCSHKAKGEESFPIDKRTIAGIRKMIELVRNSSQITPNNDLLVTPQLIEITDHEQSESAVDCDQSQFAGEYIVSDNCEDENTAHGMQNGAKNVCDEDLQLDIVVRDVIKEHATIGQIPISVVIFSEPHEKQATIEETTAPVHDIAEEFSTITGQIPDQDVISSGPADCHSSNECERTAVSEQEDEDELTPIDHDSEQSPPTREEFNAIVRRIAELEAANAALKANQINRQNEQTPTPSVVNALSQRVAELEAINASLVADKTNDQTRSTNQKKARNVVVKRASNRKRLAVTEMAIVGELRPPGTKALKIMDEDGRFKCQHCEQAFKCYRNVDEHLNLHYKTSLKVKCDECSKSFSNDSNLQKHIKVTHQGERYNCKECTKSYATNQMLKTHIKKHHTTNEN